MFTRHEPLAPARVLADAYVDAAVLSPGSVVAGDVTRSVVSTRCRVGANAVVRDSVLLPGAVVGDGCILDKVIVDCDATIPPQHDARRTTARRFAVLRLARGHRPRHGGTPAPAPPFDIAARAIA